jgi:large repetitive protein
VAGNTSVSTDQQTISFLPSAPLGVSRNYSVLFSNRGITDLAGNLLICSSLFCNFSFNTGTASSTTPPSVTGVSPANQLTSVPINTQVVVQFNEPVDRLTLGQVVLSGPSGAVNAALTLSNGQTTLILTPVVPLAASTQYTLTIAGVQDLSGNAMSAPFSSAFTTAPGADLTRATVTGVSPASNATLVPTNTVITVQFSKRINPLTVSASTFTITPSGGTSIAGSVVVSADFRSATFTPSAPLLNNKIYNVSVTGGIVDLTGQTLIGFGSSFTTTP